MRVCRGACRRNRATTASYSVSRPAGAFLRQLVNIDYRQHMALVAVRDFEGGDKFIGVARYVTTSADVRHEFAVVVADDWQGRGIATELLVDLFLHARRHGLKQLYGTVLPSNSRMLSLANRLGLETHMSADDARLVAVFKRLDAEAG